MEQYFKILKNCPLFRSFNDSDFIHILPCLNIQIKKYKADDFIFLLGDQVDSIGIVLEGTVEIIKENLVGNRHIIASLGTSNIFAEGIVCTKDRISPVSVLTKTETTVMLIPYQKVITSCEQTCNFHIQLIENMMILLGEKNYILNHKIDLLMIKGMKEKLATFLLYESRRHNSNRFDIDFNRNELAEYLNVSRPSMSRELANMKDNGIIDYHMNSFHILSPKKLKQCIDEGLLL